MPWPLVKADDKGYQQNTTCGCRLTSTSSVSLKYFTVQLNLNWCFFDMFTKCKLAKSLVDLKRKAWIYNCLYVFPLRSAVLIVFVISNVKHTTRTVRNTVLTFWEVTTLNLLGETLFDIAIDSSYFVMENSKKTWHWVDAAESSTSLLRGENTTLIGGSKLKKKDTLKKQNKTKQIPIHLIVTPYFEMTWFLFVTFSFKTLCVEFL